MSETAIPQTLGQLGSFQSFADLDLSKVDTNYPVLESAIYPWTINKAYVAKSSDQKSMFIVLEMSTDVEAKDKNGKIVPAGYKHIHRVGLTPTFEEVNGQPDFEKPKRTGDMIIKDIATVLDAVYGEAARKTISLASFDVSNLVNQKVIARTSISEEKNGFMEATRISRFIKREGTVAELPTATVG